MDQNFHRPQVVNDEIIYFILQMGMIELPIFIIVVNAILDITFWFYFYFGLYFSILLLLVLKIKNAYYFSPYC